jgi:hypothetical protein
MTVTSVRKAEPMPFTGFTEPRFIFWTCFSNSWPRSPGICTGRTQYALDLIGSLAGCTAAKYESGLPQFLQTKSKARPRSTSSTSALRVSRRTRPHSHKNLMPWSPVWGSEVELISFMPSSDFYKTISHSNCITRYGGESKYRTSYKIKEWPVRNDVLKYASSNLIVSLRWWIFPWEKKRKYVAYLFETKLGCRISLLADPDDQGPARCVMQGTYICSRYATGDA